MWHSSYSKWIIIKYLPFHSTSSDKHVYGPVFGFILQLQHLSIKRSNYSKKDFKVSFEKQHTESLSPVHLFRGVQVCTLNTHQLVSTAQMNVSCS